MSEYTPTPNLGLPWYADQDQREGYEWNVHVVEHNDPNMRICFMANGPDSVERAAHLVKAANSHDQLMDFVSWIDCWVSNPVGSYSVSALDGLFDMTRDRIAALASIKE